jgi:hypothetical protein
VASAGQGLPPGLRRICTLEIHNGQITAAVDDNGHEVYGEAACAALISAGWVRERAARSGAHTQ